jgi:hypothetical protein
MVVILTSSTTSNNLVQAGSSYSVWQNTSLTGPSLPTTIVDNAPTQINPSFDDTHQFGGITGTLNFTGVGGVNNNSPLQVYAYYDSAYTTPVNQGNASVSVNGGSFSYGLPVTNTSLYLQAFYGQPNNGNGPATCAPVTNLGLVTINPPTTGLNITLTDSNLYNCGAGDGLSGTVTYAVSGATVDANHPIIVRAWPTSNGLDYSSIVTQNGGSYFMGLPAGNYNVSEEYVASGNGGSSNGNYSVGSYIQNMDGSCPSGSGPSGSSYNVSSAAVSNLVFSNACSQLTGFTGTLTYTGSYGNNGLFAMAVTTASEDTENNPSASVYNNGDVYNLQTPSGTYYIRVWYDSNNNSCAGNNGCVPTTGEPWNVYGPYTTNTGSPVYNISFPGSMTW